MRWLFLKHGIYNQCTANSGVYSQLWRDYGALAVTNVGVHLFQAVRAGSFVAIVFTALQLTDTEVLGLQRTARPAHMRTNVTST